MNNSNANLAATTVHLVVQLAIIVAIVKMLASCVG